MKKSAATNVVPEKGTGLKPTEAGIIEEAVMFLQKNVELAVSRYGGKYAIVSDAMRQTNKAVARLLDACPVSEGHGGNVSWIENSKHRVAVFATKTEWNKCLVIQVK